MLCLQSGELYLSQAEVTELWLQGCGDKTYQNSTYLTLNTTAQGSCNFQVCSTQSSVCQLRLDFESFSLTGPLEDNFTNAVDSVVKNSHSIVGQCLSDTFIGKE